MQKTTSTFVEETEGKKKMEWQERIEIAADLDWYAGIEGTELGEAATAIAQALRRSDYMGDDFVKALEKEAAQMLSMFRTDFVVSKEEKTHSYTVYTLEEKNGDG